MQNLVRITNITHAMPGGGYSCWIVNKQLNPGHFTVADTKELPENWESLRTIFSFEFFSSVDPNQLQNIQANHDALTAKIQEIAVQKAPEATTDAQLRSAVRDVLAEMLPAPVAPVAPIDMSQFIAGVVDQLGTKLAATGVQQLQSVTAAKKLAEATFVPDIKQLESSSVNVVATEVRSGTSRASLKDKLKKAAKPN